MPMGFSMVTADVRACADAFMIFSIDAALAPQYPIL
jgi:hypothetical protein